MTESFIFRAKGSDVDLYLDFKLVSLYLSCERGRKFAFGVANTIFFIVIKFIWLNIQLVFLVWNCTPTLVAYMDILGKGYTIYAWTKRYKTGSKF